MLSRTPHQTAQQLGIEPWEHAGLVAFIEAARAGCLCHTAARAGCLCHTAGVRGLSEEQWADFQRGCLRMFNMGTTYQQVPDCGTVMCMGGFVAEHAHRTSPDDYVCNLTPHHPLHGLYYPGLDRGCCYCSITPTRAADVAEHYLLTGIIDWNQ